MKLAAESEKSTQADLADMQKSIEQLKGELTGLKTEMASGQSAADSLADAITKAQQAAEKLPGDARLTDAVTHLKTAAEGISSDLAATQKSLDEKSRSLDQSESNLVGLQKRLQKLTAEVVTARQQVETLSASVKAVAEKADGDAKALAQATVGSQLGPGGSAALDGRN